MTATFGVSALAERVGVAPDTIRYYERRGLIAPPQRSTSDYRRYDDTAVDRMQFIQGAQRLGLRLADIKTLLDVRDTGVCPCEPAEQLLKQRISDVDTELAKLTTLRAALAAMIDKLPSPDCPDPLPGTWTPRTKEVTTVNPDDCCGSGCDCDCC